MEKSGVALLKMYFEPPSLTMDELKALPIPDRLELAELVAKELGYSRLEKDGKVAYVK